MKFKPSQYNIVVNRSFDKTYLYNAFSGGFCSLDNNVYEEINHGYSESGKYFFQLLSEGYIVPNPVDEFNRFLIRQREYIFGSKSSIRFVIAPSLSCNFNCVYCFEHGNNNLNPLQNTMSTDVLEKTLSFILKKIQQNRSIKKLYIDWFGGEPLLQLSKIVWLSERLIKYCKKNDISYYSFMITNGNILSAQVANILSKKCGIKRIQLTLDGNDAFYQTYKNAKKGDLTKLIHQMEYASRLFKIDVRMNTSKENREAIIQISKKLMDNKNISDNLTVYPAQITDCNLPMCHSLSDFEFENFRVEFESQLKPYRTGNGSKSIKVARRILFCSSMKENHYVIGPNGNIYKCEHELGKTSEVMGNVFWGLYHNDAESKYYNTIAEKKCQYCAFFPFCFGGCPSARIIYHKKVDCETMKKRIHTKLYNELFLRK